MIDLSIVLPSYREAENLTFLLPQLTEVLEALGVAYEVLVVDTPEPLDETPRVASENRATHLCRRGGDRYGDAYRTGISASRGTFVLFMDADGSHPPSFVATLWAAREEADVVMASRYVSGGENRNGAISVGMSRLLNAIFGRVLGIACHDLSNSYKLYRGDQLRALTLRCANFDVIPEILLKLHRAYPKLQILEVPFQFERRVFGESKRSLVWFMTTYLWTLVRLRFSSK